jgi:hypothetical protein
VSRDAASCRNSAQINRTTLALGFFLHTTSFMVGGSLMVAAVSIICGRRQSSQHKEQTR